MLRSSVHAELGNNFSGNIGGKTFLLVFCCSFDFYSILLSLAMEKDIILVSHFSSTMLVSH